MPCTSGYMEPTVKERQIQQAAQLYIYAWEKRQKLSPTKGKIPSFIKNEAENIYAQDDRCMVKLCSLLTKLQKEDSKLFEKIVYNAKSKNSRRLADWWEEHLKEDKKRVAIENRKKLSKVTSLDVEVYGTGNLYTETTDRIKSLEGLSIFYDGGRFSIRYKDKNIFESTLVGSDFSVEIRKAVQSDLEEN